MPTLLAQKTSDSTPLQLLQQRRQVFRVVIFAILALLSLLIADFFALEISKASRKELLRANELERTLSNILSSLQDAETGQRGYLLTGDQEYLDPYLKSLRAMPEQLATLRSFLPPNGGAKRYYVIDSLIISKFDNVSASIGIKRQHKDSSNYAIPQTNALLGKATMDTLREEIRLLRNDERAKVTKNIARMKTLTGLSLALRMIVVLIVSLILYFIYSRMLPLNLQLERVMQDKDREISVRRAAEARNQELIKTLENKNEELDNFAYIASHDLQEPLRTVKNFVTVIQEDFGDNIGPEGETYFSFITDATDRMSLMIKTLLNYSQLGRGKKVKQVDLNQVLEGARQNLLHQITETKATITAEKLPTLPGYPVELQQVFQNLLSNAMKFTRPGVPPEISISCTKTPTHYELAFRDNGIGIAEKSLAKIFKMFTRVNSAGAFEGHGIGLSFCRKIIESHGGRIRVSSTPGTGSTFTLTLPHHAKNDQKA